MDPTTIVEAANPRVPRGSVVDEKQKVLRTVQDILNKLTPETFDPLFQQLLTTGINTPEILQGVINLIFTKAVDEPTFCPMYAALCEKLSRALPEFPPSNGAGRGEGGAGEGGAEEGGAGEGGAGAGGNEPISFRSVLLNTCQEEFERAVKLRIQAGELLESLQEGSTKGDEGGEEEGGEERGEEEGGEEEGGEERGEEEGGEEEEGGKVEEREREGGGGEEGGEERGEEEGGEVDGREREGGEGGGVEERGEGEGEGKGAKKRGRIRGGRKRKGKGENCTKEVQGSLHVERGEGGEDEGTGEGDEEGGIEGEKGPNEDDDREKREGEQEREKGREEEKGTREEEKEQRRAKARTVGTIRLIGELFLQRMIPEPVVHACVQVRWMLVCEWFDDACMQVSGLMKHQSVQVTLQNQIGIIRLIRELFLQRMIHKPVLHACVQGSGSVL
ncbi:unnamed protein product [Closterium sp. NIES-64]|nr:unnamed protein product [Closterium sp. NIES-64]